MDGEISTDEVAELLDAETPPRIVDIRSPAAFARGHIPGSENVPFGELPDRIESFAGADHIVTVCPHGKASVQAARLITSYEGTAGARVESMAGGLDDWEGPLESDVDVDVESETESGSGTETETETETGSEAPF
jgi:rhodanese-related sulfurtransferase